MDPINKNYEDREAEDALDRVISGQLDPSGKRARRREQTRRAVDSSPLAIWIFARSRAPKRGGRKGVAAPPNVAMLPGEGTVS